MKYLKLFETEAEYTQFKDSEQFITPNVSYIENSDVVMYNPYVAPVSLIEFTINGASYQAEEGMTWQEFVESSYNDGNVIYDAQYHSISYSGNPIFNNGINVHHDAVIISGTDYISEEVG